MATHISDQAVPDCVTVDQTDDLALNNARVAFPDLAHSSTSRAVNNLLDCLPVGTAAAAMIVGHGIAGTIITGDGNQASDPDKMISTTNIPDWEPQLAQLVGNITELIFCSCDTGRGTAGADLLQEVATRIQARATAFTSFIFIDAAGGISWEPDGEWIHVDPKPQPWQPDPYAAEAGMHIKLKYDDTYRTVRLKKETSVAFFTAGASENEPAALLHGARAEEILRLVNRAEPMETTGAPLALVTGRMQIKFNLDESSETRSFVIYNDRLLQDQSAPRTFYRTSPGFSHALAKLREDGDK